MVSEFLCVCVALRVCRINTQCLSACVECVSSLALAPAMKTHLMSNATADSELFTTLSLGVHWSHYGDTQTFRHAASNFPNIALHSNKRFGGALMLVCDNAHCVCVQFLESACFAQWYYEYCSVVWKVWKLCDSARMTSEILKCACATCKRLPREFRDSAKAVKPAQTLGHFYTFLYKLMLDDI